MSLKDGSFYAGSHLEFTEALELTYWWSRGATISNAVQETGQSHTTVVDWYNFHRDVCTQYFIDHPVEIGGVGKIVEVDESKVDSRKYNRGRCKGGHWGFGGLERGSGNAFMVEVPDLTF